MEKYHILTRILHWIVGISIIGALGVGIYMTGMPNSPDKSALYAAHKAFGALILFLVIFRLIVRLSTASPAKPDGVSALDYKLASAGVVLLYLLMFITPISGYLMSVFGGHEISFFGLFTLPAPFEVNMDLAKLMHSIHVNIWYLFITVVVLHILGAFKHLLIDKVNIFRRIT